MQTASVHASEHSGGGEAANDPPPLPAGLTLRVLCHVADLGNCAIKWEHSKDWAARVCEEAISQAGHEQQLGLPHGRLEPYSPEELATRQLVFLDGWVKPLLKVAAAIFPSVTSRLRAAQDCREACKSTTLKTKWQAALKHATSSSTSSLDIALSEEP